MTDWSELASFQSQHKMEGGGVTNAGMRANNALPWEQIMFIHLGSSAVHMLLGLPTSRSGLKISWDNKDLQGVELSSPGEYGHLEGGFNGIMLHWSPSLPSNSALFRIPPPPQPPGIPESYLLQWMHVPLTFTWLYLLVRKSQRNSLYKWNLGTMLRQMWGLSTHSTLHMLNVRITLCKYKEQIVWLHIVTCEQGDYLCAGL